MFGNSQKDKTIAFLTSQVNDLTALIGKIVEQHTLQVKDLTDKMVASSNPNAFRALSEPPQERPTRTSSPPRAFLPGHKNSAYPENPRPPLVVPRPIPPPEVKAS